MGGQETNLDYERAEIHLITPKSLEAVGSKKQRCKRKIDIVER